MSLQHLNLDSVQQHIPDTVHLCSEHSCGEGNFGTGLSSPLVSISWLTLAWLDLFGLCVCENDKCVRVRFFLGWIDLVI